MSNHKDRRSATRRPLFAPAYVRTANHSGFEVVVSDLSAEGACLAGFAISGPIEPRLMVRLTGMESLGVHVRWTNGSIVGVEFEWPLYEPVVDHLVMQNGGVR